MKRTHSDLYLIRSYCADVKRITRMYNVYKIMAVNEFDRDPHRVVVYIYFFRFYARRLATFYEGKKIKKKKLAVSAYYYVYIIIRIVTVCSLLYTNTYI